MSTNTTIRALITFILLTTSFPSLTQTDLPPVLKEVIKLYYSIPDQVEKIDWTNENSAKDRLLAQFKEVLTEPVLSEFVGWIETTSIKSSHYSLLFEEIRPIDPIAFLTFEKTDSGYNVMVHRTKRETLLGAENLPSIDGFIKKYKISNYTQSDLERVHAQSPVPELIEHTVESKIEEEFQLKEIKDGWRITNIREKNLISSKLTIHEPKLQ